MGVKERREREKARRRQQILDAARRLFLDNGYFDVRMDDIAEDAELAIGTLYIYFQNKDDIYATLCEEGLDILSRFMAEAAHRGETYQEKLESMGGAYLDYYDILSFVGLGFKHIGLSPEMEERITRKSDESIKILEGVVKAGMKAGEISKGNSKETAFFLWGLLEGLIFIHRRGYMEAWSVNLAKTAATAMDTMYRGLRP
jgi:AcrR family transcriptional regulator